MTKTILLVGNSGVGKTCFLNRLIHDTWNPKFFPTEKFNVVNATINKKQVKFIDFAGQNLFLKTKLPKIDLIVYFYSKDSYISFQNIPVWREKFNSDEKIKELVLCTKSDIKENPNWNILLNHSIVEFSSRFGTNVDTAWNMIESYLS